MNVNSWTICLGAFLAFLAITLMTDNIQWGFVAGLSISVGGFKWLRIKRKEAKEELEYDERVNLNILQCSLYVYSGALVLLLSYLIISSQILNNISINIELLIWYLVITLFLGFYIVPVIIKRR
ncbi:hypothetical protein BK139_10410 [Paenibacillus sp. FSL R5-0490]|uniref:hypothetical protein n=1 Tax=Bacillales TaxID=1385 RepID=UPI00096C5AA6|nr:hypothetical protein [Paenibacillus sp. FSL R5-0490]OMF60343.1 hypothetical protein BK139_10410 [Paenibacillus sp. FSL R5-0490]